MSLRGSLRALLRAVLLTPDDFRLRAPYRIVFTLVGAVLFTALFGVAVVDAFGADVVPRSILWQTVLLGTGTTVAVAVAGVTLDRRRFADFGFRLDRDWWLDLGFGLALGAALMTLVFAVALAAGWVRVVRVASLASGAFVVDALATVALFAFIGFYEELLARGYLLKNVAEGVAGLDRVGPRGGVAAGVVVSSALFGFLHAGNPGATLLSSLSVSLAGVMLALGYVFTGELAIPIGMHVTWNLFQGAVYGFPVSGFRTPVQLVALETSGPTAVVGGDFGPEAGLLGVGAMVVGTACIVAWARYRNHGLAVDPRIPTVDRR